MLLIMSGKEACKVIGEYAGEADDPPSIAENHRRTKKK
jgi:hypothetical protein